MHQTNQIKHKTERPKNQTKNQSLIDYPRIPPPGRRATTTTTTTLHIHLSTSPTTAAAAAAAGILSPALLPSLPRQLECYWILAAFRPSLSFLLQPPQLCRRGRREAVKETGKRGRRLLTKRRGERERERDREGAKLLGVFCFHSMVGLVPCSSPSGCHMTHTCGSLVSVYLRALQSPPRRRKKKQKKESGLCGQPTKAALDFAEFSFRNFAEEKEIQLYLSGSIFLVN